MKSNLRTFIFAPNTVLNSCLKKVCLLAYLFMYLFIIIIYKNTVAGELLAEHPVVEHAELGWCPRPMLAIAQCVCVAGDVDWLKLLGTAHHE